MRIEFSAHARFDYGIDGGLRGGLNDALFYFRWRVFLIALLWGKTLLGGIRFVRKESHVVHVIPVAVGGIVGTARVWFEEWKTKLHKQSAEKLDTIDCKRLALFRRSCIMVVLIDSVNCSMGNGWSY